MKDKIIEIITECLEGVSDKTLEIIADKIEDVYSDVDNLERLVEVEFLKELLEHVKKLKYTFTNVEPQSTEDILLVNDLKGAEYKLETLINKL
tara:strand:- start:2952 stop:3230 length:279 start_codon:yes stop_codon:yes gene_type:complete